MEPHGPLRDCEYRHSPVVLFSSMVSCETDAFTHVTSRLLYQRNMLSLPQPFRSSPLFYRYRPSRPGVPAYTIFLTVLWLLLALYIITHPDPFGIIILVVMGIFIAGPALFLVIGLRRAPRSLHDPASDDAPANAQSVDAMNGHHRQNGHGANGTSSATGADTPDETGDIGEMGDAPRHETPDTLEDGGSNS